MTLQLSGQPVLRAVQSILQIMIGAPADTSRRAQHGTRLEIVYRDLTAAGDVLIDALLREQEFSRIDFTQAEEDVLERWRLHRKTVESMAENYASTLSNWRQTLLADCLESATVRISN
ncbi:hypothetical protein SBA6_1010017 [Candidatus Sulfopaludibacter sp. SbA6]|nr:hypothetical protein SBA6_1010017 [Candidatus Sulfopaludibacter sp. SbA6]